MNSLAEPGEQIFDQSQLDRYIADLSQSELVRLFDKAGEAKGWDEAAGIGVEDYDLMVAFGDMFGEADLEVVRLSGSDLRERLAEDNNAGLEDVEQTFFALDIDFQQEGLSATEGFEFAKTLLQRESVPAVIAVLARTDEPGGENDEDVKRLELVELIDEGRERAAVIGKFRIADGGKRLPYGLRRGFLGRAFSQLRPLVEEAVTSAQKKSLEKLRELDLPTFGDVVVTNIVREGVWPPDGLADLVRLYESDAVETELRMDDEVRRIAAECEKIVTPPASKTKLDEGSSATLREVLRKHVYHDEAYLSTGPHPPMLGDVFQLGKRLLVLVAQPCDLMIRSHGWRGGEPNDEESRLRHWASRTTLLSLGRSCDPTQQSGKKGKKRPAPKDHEIDLPIGPLEAEPEVNRIDLRYRMFVPLWLIDYACGRASGTDSSLDPVPCGWAKRLQNVKGRIEEIETQCKSVLKISDERTEAFDLAIHALFGLDPFLAREEVIARTRSEEPANIQAKRIARVREPFAVQLLAALSVRSARPALPYNPVFQER